jgi:DNA recombination protein RmuC
MGITIFISLVIGVVAAVVVFLIMKGLSSRDSGTSDLQVEMSRGFAEFQREILSVKTALHDQSLSLVRQLNEQLSQNTRFLSDTHQNYNQAISQVQHRLGELQQATKSMLDVGRDISSLHDILHSPKLRGGFGELFLGELLKDILPAENFALQYGFKDGKKVDAVIFLGQGIVPIDAKFPLENFKRLLTETDEERLASVRKSFIQDVKKHIDSIAGKYILPDEGTFEFALMYIPAENVYYETIIKDYRDGESLSEYALKSKVIPVSPNSFYAYLQAIVRGLKGLRIEKSAQLILENLGQLETDLKKFCVDFDKVGGHLSNAHSAYDKSVRGFDKLRFRINSLSKQDSDQGAEPLPQLPETPQDP